YSKLESENFKLSAGRAVKGLKRCVGSLSLEPWGLEHPATGGRVTG
ncbi:MAG: hypothetical protein PWP35_1484, partial [Bacteroidales bacterium]|nr:hypothetical protein [Bacteroidales bacterium]